MAAQEPPIEIKQHIALEINETWMESVERQASMSFHKKTPTKPAIFRVPPSLRCNNQLAYEPQVVSIGPYHRDKSMSFKVTKELKFRLLHHYLSILPDGSKNEGLKKMNDLKNQAQDYYSEDFHLDSDQFIEMLLLDGCFLVQIFIALDPDWRALQAMELKSLLFGNMWFRDLLLLDLLRLENQIPYFIVEHLLDILRMPGWNSVRLQRVAIRWFGAVMPKRNYGGTPGWPKQRLKVDHLLHLVHKWIRKTAKSEKLSNTRSCCKLQSKIPCCTLSTIANKIRACLTKVLPCCDSSLSKKFSRTSLPTTTELVEAGVKIKARQANSFLDILFCKDKGELGIPAIEIEDRICPVLANLIAFEQYDRRHGLDVTHYFFFLDQIINTPTDVELLHQKGIIGRWLGDDEAIASLFNKLGKDVFYDSETNYLKGVYTDLNAYCQSRWPRWRAKAVHDYFNNPWTIISLGAAVLLLALTAVQTILTILQSSNRG